MKKHLTSRILSLLLATVLCIGLIAPAGAVSADSHSQQLEFEKLDETVSSKLPETAYEEAESSDVQYAADDTVRVSIVLEKASTVEKFGSTDLTASSSAAAYRNKLKSEQASMTQKINAKLGDEIDVVWNLTFAANIISANVRYDQIEEIENIKGVKSVLIENRYEPMVVDQAETNDPNMATSSAQIGSSSAWAAGYTGVGSKIAIIDTGLDYEQQSFASAGYEYALALSKDKNLTIDEYKEQVGVMTKDDLTAELLKQLNVTVSADKAYLSSKIPFAYNYIDQNYTIDHMHDQQGEHGSHVAGIAAANAYIQQADGTFASALDTVKVQGVAPDAQLIIMKVFGAGGGAYDSDYMAAIEDAVVLGCDSVNLSLGSGNPGFSRVDAEYAELMANLTECGTVVSMSAGNSGYWAENSQTGYLYADDVSMQADGSPGSFTNSLAVASVDNDGFTGSYFSAAGRNVFWNETDYSNAKLETLAGTHDYVILPAGVAGNAADFEGIDVTGKIVFVQRGGISFYQKGENAVNAGAIATVVYNNTSGVINMDLSDYSKTEPCVSITMADGLAIWAASEKSEDGKYATGSMTIQEGISSVVYGSDYYTMSSFSSWGVPGSLELKPEITAPGGSIYSVNGAHKGDGAHDSHTAYETMSGTSMASPQVAGMAAVMGQYIRENNLTEKTGLTARQLINSLLMSTATPVKNVDEYIGEYTYSVLNQGAGLANVGDAINAASYILVKDNLSGTAGDGKVKAEFGDDPLRKGEYSFEFSVNNLSGQPQEYTFTTDLFTQDIFAARYTAKDVAIFMDTLTVPLAANVTYEVDGETYVPHAAIDCDINGDGTTDAQDAQCILAHVTGEHEDGDDCNLTIADLNEDGQVNSYDAHLLLENMTAASVEVPVGTPVNVKVNIKLTDEIKAYLDEYYTNGAYVEGYVYVGTNNTDDGAILPVHSIPMLGFYGNWSDASMLDTATTVEQLYGDNRPTYLGLSSYTNYNTIKYPGEKTESIYTVNPYLIEGDSVEDIPYDRAAISSGSTLSKYVMSVIRNAAAAVYFVKDENTNEVVYMGGVTEQFFGAYYYTNGSQWRNTGATLTANQKVSALGFKEGDKFTAGVALIPEYYLTSEYYGEKGTLDRDQIAKLIASGELGEGAYFANTYTVDDTAPEVLSVSKNLLATDDEPYGALTVIAKDNQYISSIGIYNASGKKLVSKDGVSMMGLPKQDAAGKTVGLVFPLDDTVGEYITVTVTDYAGNETSYKVRYGGTPEDFTGRMFGFTSGTARGDGQRWVEIDPENLTSTEGMVDYAGADYEVYAADYAGKYVFFATEDGIYAAPMDDLETTQKVATYASFTANEMVADMAFNTQNGTMYVLTNTISNLSNGTIGAAGNKLYSLNVTTGEFTKVADVTITHPTSQTNQTLTLRAMTIDDSGNFYAVNAGTSTVVQLYQWTLADISENGVLTVEAPGIRLLGTSGLYTSSYASMAYDHAKGIVYLAGGYGAKGSKDVDNELWVINTETKTASHPNTKNAQFSDHTVGLFVVPANTITLPQDASVTKVELSQSALTVLKGSSLELSASVYPWLVADKSVTWSSSDAETVSVESNGTITALKEGTATITATSAADSSKYAECVVTVEALPEIKASALIYDDDSKAYWADFSTNDTTAWTKANETAASNYVAGTYHEGEILLHDGSTMFGVDPDTFAVTSYGTIASSWTWSDAAASPVSADGYFGKMLGLCNGGTCLEMLNPAEGTLSYWDLSTKGFADDPMATIAYAGSGTYLYETWLYDLECPANFYYILTESGELYYFNVFTTDDGESYTAAWEDLGSTGLELTNVSAVTAGQYASMIYDQATGYLLVSSYSDGEEAKLYAIDPEVLIPALVGTFGEKVWPVVSLYQYDRATDLTLKVNPTSATIFVGDNFAVSTKVILGSTDELTWTTSNADVATVENGVITGVSEGDATITATTVATNAAGEHVSKDINVTVKGYVEANANIKAQVTTEEGTMWASIDLSTKSISKDGDASTQFYGGGYAVGALWGTNIYDAAGNIYKVDAATFAETQGSGCSTSYAIRDLADNPAVTFTLTEADGTEHTATTFGDPIYISNTDGLFELVDFVEGNLSGWNASSSYTDLAAIAYIGNVTVDVVNTMLSASSQITECDAGTLCHVYYVLNVDGDLYQYITVPVWDVTADEGEEVGAILVRGLMGNIGMTFTDTMNLSMAYVEFADDNYGLLIADATDASIYYANLAGNEYTCGKVCKLDGVTGISSLYNAEGQEASTDAMNHMLGISAAATAADDENVLTASAAVSLRTELAETEVVGKSAELEVVGKADVAANVTTGSLNAVKPQSVEPSTGDAKDDHSVTVTLTDDVDATNGVYTVKYDASKLTFKSLASNAQVSSYKVDAAAGTITFAFASEEAVAANTALATITFEYGDYVKTSITVTAKERNDAAAGDSKTIELENEIGEHVWDEGTITTAPTCTATGIKTYTCTNCGATKTEEVEALGHDWDEGTVTTAPTCTEKGVKTYACSRCDATKTEEIDATGHTPVELPAKAATCTETGLTAGSKCDVCGEILVAQEPTEALGHDWDEGTVTTAPTCTEKGVKTYTCSRCDATKTEEIDALGHTPVELPAKAATCTETGLTAGSKCDVCGEILVAQEPTEALGHDWDEGTTTTAPTCTATGVKTYTCSRCDETKTEVIPALGHQFQTLPDGTTVCLRCGLTTGTPNPSKPSDPTEPSTKLPFTDVSEGDDIYNAVKYLYENDIMKGTTETLFSPEDALTRGMIVTILYRIEGEPAVTTSGSFQDVGANSYCAKAVEWAAANGIVNGFQDGLYRPNQAATLEQMAAILCRYAAFKGLDTTASESAIPAGAVVSNWAKANVAWAAAEGIFTQAQLANTTVGATRADAATALYAYLTQVAE